MHTAVQHSSSSQPGVPCTVKELQSREDGPAADSHDPASVRKQNVAGVIAELQLLYARRGAEPR